MVTVGIATMDIVTAGKATVATDTATIARTTAETGATAKRESEVVVVVAIARSAEAQAAAEAPADQSTISIQQTRNEIDHPIEVTAETEVVVAAEVQDTTNVLAGVPINPAAVVEEAEGAEGTMNLQPNCRTATAMDVVQLTLEGEQTVLISRTPILTTRRM